MDLSAFNRFFALVDELDIHVNKVLVRAPARNARAREVPILDLGLLNRIESERQTVLAALGTTKLGSDEAIEERLSAASAPLPATQVEGRRSQVGPSAAHPATPGSKKTMTNPKRKKS